MTTTSDPEQDHKLEMQSVVLALPNPVLHLSVFTLKITFNLPRPYNRNDLGKPREK